MLVETAHVLAVGSIYKFFRNHVTEIHSRNKCGGMVSEPVKNFINLGDGT